MDTDMFSWQRDDYKRFLEAYTKGARILLIHGKDFNSPYHVLPSILQRLPLKVELCFASM